MSKDSHLTNTLQTKDTTQPKKASEVHFKFISFHGHTEKQFYLWVTNSLSTILKCIPGQLPAEQLYHELFFFISYEVMLCDIILILGCVSSSRRLLLALLSLPFTPDGPTDGHSNVLLVHWLSRQPACMSCSSLSYLSVQIPKLGFYLPVNHRFIAILHMTNNKPERGRVCCDA